ncbi:MAG TPA: biopolymer transporter ExbD [Bryobacteraceae bacterium]|nr:biopolymer transporter ExbD [Bryobacteraceae bacterium]
MTTGKQGEINVTPMIDVLLVLIIIFMLIGPERSTGLEAQVPQPGGRDSDDRQIVISVGQDRSVKINTQAVAWEQLDPRLRQIFAMRPDGVLFVAGARQAEFEDVARVFDIARGAGILHVALMPKR